MSPRLTIVLAPNGLGHARRALGILARFFERGGRAVVTVIGEPWQLEGSASWDSAATLARATVTWQHDVTSPGVSWSTDPSSYDDGRLMAYLAANGEILSRRYTGDRVIVHCRLPQRHLGQLEKQGVDISSRSDGNGAEVRSGSGSAARLQKKGDPSLPIIERRGIADGATIHQR